MSTTTVVVVLLILVIAAAVWAIAPRGIGSLVAVAIAACAGLYLLLNLSLG